MPHYEDRWRRALPCAAGLLACLILVSDALGTDLEIANIPSRCQGQQIAERLVVASRYEEDVSWMAIHLEVPFLVYQAEERQMHEYVANRHSNVAREASAFLQFIAEYYDCLPEATAFIHGHRTSWHSPDIVRVLHLLQWQEIKRYLPLQNGYFDEYGPWFMSYPTAPEKHLQTAALIEPATHNETQGRFEEVDGRLYLSDDVFHYRQSLDVANAWTEFFEPAGLGPLPEEIRYMCCAQFVVPKSKIMLRPREFYLQAIHWLEHTSMQFHNSAKYSRGLIYETIWHILFGEESFLPYPDQSQRCTLFGC